MDPITRLPKLNKPDDYILWERRVYACIRRNDPEMLGFQTVPPITALPTGKNKWFQMMIKAKTTIILRLENTALASVRNMTRN